MSDSEFPGLGFDPAPGQPASVAELAQVVQSVTSHLESTRSTLESVGKTGSTWEGEAAQKFSQKIGELPGYLTRGEDAMRKVASELSSWHTRLSDFQNVARQLEERARAAREKVRQAENNPNLKSFPAGMLLDTPELQREYELAKQAQQALDSAIQELNDLIDEGKKLYDRYEDAANDIARRIKEAASGAPLQSFWESIKQKVGGLLDGIKNVWNKAKDWLAKHAETFKKIGDILSKASAVVGILALASLAIPVVGEVAGPILGGISAALAGGALVTHGLAKMGGADVSWMTLGLDALGAIPGGKAIGAFKGGLKFARGAEEAAETAAKLGLKATPGEARSILGAVKEIGKDAWQSKSLAPLKDVGSIFEKRAVDIVKGSSFGERLKVAGEAIQKVYDEGQWLGTKGANMVLNKIGKTPIDPTSLTGRLVDLGGKTGGFVLGEVYHAIAGGH